MYEVEAYHIFELRVKEFTYDAVLYVTLAVVKRKARKKSRLNAIRRP